MKTTFLLIATLLTMIACSSDDTDMSNVETLEFSLIEYTPSAILPEPVGYEPNQIRWSFDFTNMTIAVETENGLESPILPVGSYNYTLIDHSCNYENNRTVMIAGQEYGVLVLNDLDSGEVVLTLACLDGHILNFQR